MKPVTLSRIGAGVYNLTLISLLFLNIVLPNSMRSQGIVLLLFTAILSVNKIKFSRRYSLLLGFYLATLIVTAFYMLVGFLNGAPMGAVSQTLGVYVVTPLLWTVVFSAALQRFDVERIANGIKNLSYPCLLSIILFIVLFTVYGADAVSLFKQKANVNISDGRAAANMHVYGSLIFMVGGVFFSPKIMQSKVERYLLMGFLVAAVATSGRSAMFLSLMSGFILRSIGAPFAPAIIRKQVNDRVGIASLMAFAGVLAIVHLFFISYFSIDIIQSLIRYAEDIKAGGGDVRSIQVKAFWDAIMGSHAVGVGHGLGLEDVISNQKYNWRYELLLPASMYRVGAIGTLIYIAPFAFALLKAGRLQLKGALNDHEKFLLGGYFAFLLAAGTNPYIEAISFQWMVVLPMVYFILLDKTAKEKISEIINPKTLDKLKGYDESNRTRL